MNARRRQAHFRALRVFPVREVVHFGHVIVDNYLKVKVARPDAFDYLFPVSAAAHCLFFFPNLLLIA